MAGPSQMVPHHQPPTLASAEDEALKRNTDCVYFLASPLTCKKGAECEYRHSETARLNPRDCYYWLNGNCLNPKCAFRHPPLEGMLAPQVPTPSGPSFATPVSNIPHNSTKQAVPCIYFQKGFCLKGDRCPFSHGAVPINATKVSQGPIANAPFPEPSTTKKPFVGLEKCNTGPKIVEKVLNQAKLPSRTVPAMVENVIEKPVIDDYAPEYRQRTHPFANGDFISRPNRPQQVHSPQDYNTLNSKEADEISREHSPGFDVLVDDDLRETEYYRDEDQYERTRGKNVNDYDIDRAINYKDLDSMVDVEHDVYGDQRKYDSFHRPREQYGSRDQRRVSSERRRYPRSDSPDHVDESDMRYRLSKNRKVNGLRSVVSHDLDRDGGDRSNRGSSRRDSERGISDRLRGRIKLPERGRERERGNSRERLQGVRVQDRLKGRVHDDFRGPHAREMYDNNVNFAGPKTLSELRNRKNNENNKLEVPLGKRKYSENSYQQTENDASFEGPKPLSEILKRKRGGNGSEEDSKSGDKASKEVGEVSKSREEHEEGLIVEDDEVADQENGEAYADEEGEYEYEQAEGEDYIEEEGENVEEGDDYVEDDDGDDFAKKIGVMFS